MVVVLRFCVSPTAKVIRRRDLGLKSHPKDWGSPGSNPRTPVYKASSLTTTPRRLLSNCITEASENSGFFQKLLQPVT